MNTCITRVYRTSKCKFELVLSTYGILTGYGNFRNPEDTSWKHQRFLFPLGLDIANNPEFLMIRIDLCLFGLKFNWFKNV